MAPKYMNRHPISLIIKENLNHIVTFSHLLDQVCCQNCGETGTHTWLVGLYLWTFTEDN